MGTHPIFESDFDCLTDKNCKMFVSRQVCFLRKLAKAFTRDPRAAARLPDKKYIVGRDHYGNVYFEVGRSRQVSHAIDQLSDEKVKELNTFGKAEAKTAFRWSGSSGSDTREGKRRSQKIF